MGVAQWCALIGVLVSFPDLSLRNSMDSFGISLDPLLVTQRHTLDDSEDEDEEETPVIFSVVGTASSNNRGTLLMAVGQTPAVFVRSFLDLEKEPAYVVTTETARVVKNSCFPSPSKDLQSVTISEVYAAKMKVAGAPFLVCVHEKSLKSEYCNMWATRLLEHLRPETVTILDSVPSHEHFTPHTEDVDMGSFLRCLQSTAWLHSPTASFLQPPNTVKGEAAAVLTHCQVHGVAASLVVLYCDHTQSGVEHTTAMLPLLTHTVIADAICVKSKAEGLQNVKKLLPKPREDLSNLYT